MPKIVCSKEDWIALGYSRFSQRGIDGLVVEQMAKKLKCNKSSFYWHFKNKAKFLDKIVAYWIQQETQSVIDYVEARKTPTEKYQAFLEICFQHDPYLEFIFYLKRYAVKSKKHQQIIDEIDQRRLDYTASLFHGLGATKSKAKTMASVFYKYLIGYHEMHRYRKPTKHHLKLVKKELSLLIQI
jgi:AcrR family transcriptional regulator